MAKGCLASSFSDPDALFFEDAPDGGLVLSGQKKANRRSYKGDDDRTLADRPEGRKKQRMNLADKFFCAQVCLCVQFMWQERRIARSCHSQTWRPLGLLPPSWG